MHALLCKLEYLYVGAMYTCNTYVCVLCTSCITHIRAHVGVCEVTSHTHMPRHNMHGATPVWYQVGSHGVWGGWLSAKVHSFMGEGSIDQRMLGALEDCPTVLHWMPVAVKCTSFHPFSIYSTLPHNVYHRKKHSAAPAVWKGVRKATYCCTFTAGICICIYVCIYVYSSTV